MTKDKTLDWKTKLDIERDNFRKRLDDQLLEESKEITELRKESLKSQIRLNNSIAELNELRANFRKKFDDEFLEEYMEDFREFLEERKKRRNKNPLTT